jgi:dienelactone hydrolase
VLPGLVTYALRLVPSTPGPHPGLLVQLGYLGTPELACGLTKTANAADGSYRSFGLRAARHGYHVIAPHHPSGYGSLSDAVDGPLPGHPQMTVHYGKNRLHRLCVMGGGSLLGLDMLASSRAVDLLVRDARVAPGRVGVYGLSRGGQTALYLAAMDERLKASVCSAYFNHRLPKLIGPYSRTTYIDWFAEGQILPDQVRWFADADVASLIAPRAFAIEAGLRDSAVDQTAAREEFRHAAVHYQKLGFPERIEFIPHDEGHVSATARAFQFLAEHL